jgi:hypothetical protein
LAVVQRFGQKQGSAIVESCLVMALLCLILFGILQASYIVAARNVVNYSAVATARAASVGLNDFMLYKVSHYAAIPAAGPIYTPDGFEDQRPEGKTVGSLFSNAISRKNNPRSSIGEYEVAVKEAYHLANVVSYNLILDYDNWQREETDIRITEVEGEYDNIDVIHLKLEQNVPLALPFSKAFFSHLETVRAERDEDVSRYPAKLIEAEAFIEDHSKLYLGDREE